MGKAQSFGFDVLLIIISVLFFSQLYYLFPFDDDSSLLLMRDVENNELLIKVLQYNNSLAFFDSYACNANAESLDVFNNTVIHFLDSYAGSREYLLAANGLVYSSENVASVCLKTASPAIVIVNSSCGNILNFEFSIYSQGDKTSC